MFPTKSFCPPPSYIANVRSLNCEINLILNWSTDCVISSATGKTKFAITLITLITLIQNFMSEW